MFHLSLGQFLDCNRRCQVSTHHLQTIVVIAVVTSVICWRSSLPEFDATYFFPSASQCFLYDTLWFN